MRDCGYFIWKNKKRLNFKTSLFQNSSSGKRVRLIPPISFNFIPRTRYELYPCSTPVSLHQLWGKSTVIPRLSNRARCVPCRVVPHFQNHKLTKDRH